MNNFLKTPILKTKPENYLALLLVFAPVLNFLSGITFDLHAPSIPAIADYFSAPISSAKNTITISLLGFSIGCIIFGTLLDLFGRRSIIILSLLIYTIASFLALTCHSIEQLLVIRFLQGFSVSCVSIGCRTIVIDHFTGHQFKIAMLYTSLAFGLGPIIAPFVGGILQHYYGWKANFIAYGVVSFTLMLIFILYISESKQSLEKFSFKQIFFNYVKAARHYVFAPGIMILGLSQVQLLVYTVTGAVLVENVLQRSAITYGNSALLISCGYLLGTLTNRFLIKRFTLVTLINLGFSILLFGLSLQIIFALFFKLNLLTLILPIFIIGFSQGFVFINVFTSCLKLSSGSAGIATALFTAGVILMGTLGANIMSHLNIINLANLTMIFTSAAVLQWLTFFFFFRNVAKELN